MKATRFTTRQLLIGVALFCATIALLRFVVWPVVAPLTPGYWERVGEYYDLWQTQEMLSMHLAKHNGQVPDSWDNLTSAFELTKGPYASQDLATLQNQVVIDFAAISAAAADADTFDIRARPVIRLKENVDRGVTRLRPAEVEVNERLIDSLRARQ